MDLDIQEKNNKSTKHKSHDRNLQSSSRPVVSNHMSIFRSSCHDFLKPFFKFSSSVVLYSIGNLLRLFLSCSLATFIRSLWNVSVDRFRRGYVLSGVGVRNMERKRCSNQKKREIKKGTREKEINGQIDKTRKKVEESQSIYKSDEVQRRRDEDAKITRARVERKRDEEKQR